MSPRLKAILEMAKTDPTGKEFGADKFVFGDRLGDSIADPKKSWLKAVADAGLDDLRFHDLRHTAGSRMHKAGWPLAHIRDLLGHANVVTTSTYLNAEIKDLHDSMKRFGTAPVRDVAQQSDQEPQPSRNEVSAEAGNSLTH